MLAINEILQARYRIIRQLGQGGMGAVYEARDERLGSLVALKEILYELDNLPSAAQNQLLKLAFEREAKILANLHHEAFPRVIDYFLEKDRQFLVMELMQGDDLHKLLEKRGSPFSVSDVLNWAEQLLDALDYLHTQNPPIYHRDIKPQNLKITDRGKIILLDFGIAKGAEAKTQASLAHHTFVAVTMNYSPIEQIFRVLDSTFRNVIESGGHGEKVNHVSEQMVDGRSDLYALGATLYHLLTRQLPIDALKRTLEKWAGNRDILVNPSEINPNIPPEISAFLLKSVEIEREDRYLTANHMHQDLRKAMAEVKRREENAQQAVFLAEQAQLTKQRELQEQQRLQLEAEEKRDTAERLQKAEIQRQIAEERAREAERRLRENELQQEHSAHQLSTQRPTAPLSEVDLSLEATLHDYALPKSKKVESTPIEMYESPPTESLELFDTKNFALPKTEQNSGREQTDFAVGLTEASYLTEILPKNSEPTIGTENTSRNDKKIQKNPLFQLKFALLLGVSAFILLSIFGVSAFVLLQIFSATDSSSQPPGNITISTPTPLSTQTPDVLPTVTPTVPTESSPTVTPTPEPAKSNLNETTDRPKPTPTRISTPVPKPTKTINSKPPTPKPTKNPDCIFTDDC